MALDDWPSGPGAERDQKILEAVGSGQFDMSWCPLTLSDGENTLEIQVSCDALKIDGVRMQVSAQLQQKIADILAALLLTPKLVDRIYAQTDPANRLTPKPQQISASTQSSIDYSQRVDAEIQKKGASGLLANVGKDWTIIRYIFSPAAKTACPKPGGGGQCAANYGWGVTTNPWGGIHVDPSATLPGVYMIQGGPHGGTVHDEKHVDYSQVARFALRGATLNGSPVDLADVYTGVHGDAVARLVSSEGALPGFRQGGEASTPTVPPLALVPPASKTQQPPPKTPPVGGTATTSAAMGEKTTETTKGVVIGAALGGLGGLLFGTTAKWVGAVVGGGLGYFFAPKKALKNVPVSITDFEAVAASGWPAIGFYVERWKWVATKGTWQLDCIGSEKDCASIPDRAVFYAWHDLSLHSEPGTGLKRWVDDGWLYSWPA